jgi:hypothetical protein
MLARCRKSGNRFSDEQRDQENVGIRSRKQERAWVGGTNKVTHHAFVISRRPGAPETKSLTNRNCLSSTFRGLCWVGGDMFQHLITVALTGVIAALASLGVWLLLIVPPAAY